MSDFSFFLSNDTSDVLKRVRFSLDHGDWFSGCVPPEHIAPDRAATWECEANWMGQVAGMVDYVGPFGTVTCKWDVPLFGAPSYTVVASKYAAHRIGPTALSQGGVMFSVRDPARPPPDNVDPGPPKPSPNPEPAPASNVAPGKPNTINVKRTDGLYTSSPYERVTHHYPATAQEIVSLAKAKWPEIGDAGSRTLGAQWWHETGHGTHCWNHNLGNVKASNANVVHMYLRGTWEVIAEAAAQKAVAAANGLAHIASDEECKAHGWGRKAGQAVVVFNPPHAYARFLAFDSLEEGVDFWVKKHKAIAGRHQEYLGALKAGDTDVVAHVLKVDRYYTGLESQYAKNMKHAKAELDRQLGKP